MLLLPGNNNVRILQEQGVQEHVLVCVATVEEQLIQSSQFLNGCIGQALT